MEAYSEEQIKRFHQDVMDFDLLDDIRGNTLNIYFWENYQLQEKYEEY